MTASDYLHLTYLLAKRANFKNIRPNPFVGAIVVDKEGNVIGEGYHQKAGGPHAEVYAIEDALTKYNDLSECTLYVSLEPCSHTGKTPPCTSLIMQHKIPKVVIGSMDPNPLVSGAKLLKDNGVMIEKCILPEIVEMNTVFNINQIYKRPKYILKSAITLNGKIADRLGNSKWISNAKSRNFVHQVLRTNADAILTTAKTVLKDNATMNIRVEGQEEQELNVVVFDKNLDLLKEENKHLAIFYERKNTKLYLVSDKSFEGQIPNYIETIHIPIINDYFDLVLLNNALLSRNICEVLAEGGANLNTSMMKAGCIDELYMFVCPSLLFDNDAINVFSSNEQHLMANSQKLELVETKIFDSDILVKYKVLK
jgi:diaminohydroxyphosphoribosylaminopyrimidine deaminase / 5-amino-6-(5-phosphoribosylamino)uracil reductase